MGDPERKSWQFFCGEAQSQVKQRSGIGLAFVQFVERTVVGKGRGLALVREGACHIGWIMLQSRFLFSTFSLFFTNVFQICFSIMASFFRTMSTRRVIFSTPSSAHEVGTVFEIAVRRL